MSTTKVELIFDGPEVRDGLLDASVLADSLAGYGKMYARANELLNGELSQTSVLVQAEFRRGSFIVDLQLVQTIVERAQRIITTHPILDSAALATTLGFAWAHKSDLIDLFKFLKGKKPDAAIQIGGSTEITFGQNKKTVTNNVFNLYGDYAIREGLALFIAPVACGRVDRLAIGQDGKEQTTISQEEASTLIPNDLSTEGLVIPYLPMEGRREETLTVAKLAFDERTAWTFFDQGATVIAKIEDQSFWDEVHSRRFTFGEGDTLVVELIWSIERKRKLVQKNTISKVKRVIPRPQQLELSAAEIQRPRRRFRVDGE